MDKVAKLVPGAGFFEVTAGARGDAARTAAFLRGEGGLKFDPHIGAFVFGEAVLDAGGPSWQAGLAVKGTF